METTIIENLGNITVVGYLSLGVGFLVLLQSALAVYIEEDKTKGLVFLVGSQVISSQYIILPFLVKLFLLEERIDIADTALDVWLFIMCYTGIALLVFSLVSKYRDTIKRKVNAHVTSE